MQQWQHHAIADGCFVNELTAAESLPGSSDAVAKTHEGIEWKPLCTPIVRNFKLDGLNRNPHSRDRLNHATCTRSMDQRM